MDEIDFLDLNFCRYFFYISTINYLQCAEYVAHFNILMHRSMLNSLGSFSSNGCQLSWNEDHAFIAQQDKNFAICVEKLIPFHQVLCAII